jgi:hypothetical protein
MGAPGLAFETWDPSNQFPLETPTPLFVLRSRERNDRPSCTGNSGVLLPVLTQGRRFVAVKELICSRCTRQFQMELIQN